MNAPTPLPNRSETEPRERLWPLDVSIAALAGLVLYLSVTQLRFDDPRILYNAWTYAVGVPLVAILLAVSSQPLLSRYVHRSIQLGMLFSLLIHLLLLILAVNVIIFSRYFPDAFTGMQPDSTVISKTLPEYLFQKTPQETKTPDWSQPVDAETSSKVVPEEPRQLPPLEQSAPKLEAPRPREVEQPLIQKYLIKRSEAAEAQPMPADSPAKIARRDVNTRATPFNSRAPVAPSVPIEAELTQPTIERGATVRQRQAEPLSTAPAKPSPRQPEMNTPDRPSLEGARSRENELPRVGESGIQRERRLRNDNSMEPAGSAPAPQSVPIAVDDASASRMISPVDIPLNRPGQNLGAQLSPNVTSQVSLPTTDLSIPSAAATLNNPLRDDQSARSGVPEITAGTSERSPGRSNRVNLGAGMAPAGPIRLQPSDNPLVAPPAITPMATDRLQASGQPGQPSSRRTSDGSVGTAAPDLSPAGPAIDFLLDDGPLGLADLALPRAEIGIVVAADLPRVGAMDLANPTRPKRESGGPITPFGSKVSTVESFNRRVQRTQGGSAPSASGLVAPATEEAIERGLTYLASIQNEDGSWSLQGHGSDVALRSDTAATGLCLLAFQGAGYTHRQHQHADTVLRGLNFLIDNQGSNGDLYRLEDTISNQNVALYSHGIATLALCEAFGMTQDPDLNEPAQNALNYIINTQNRQRGGWRYSPQVSSDTSVTGWMMMALKSGQLAGLEVPERTYQGIERWLGFAQSPDRPDRYRYNPFAPDTPTQRHGRLPTPTMTAVGMLMRMYSGWRRDTEEMQLAADYLLQYPPQMGTRRLPQRDTYYWYYATQVMFHMGGKYWEQWNEYLNPLLLESQINNGPFSGSWDPIYPVPDRWTPHAGRLYVTTMNLLNLEVYYRHLPIYEDTAK